MTTCNLGGKGFISLSSRKSRERLRVGIWRLQRDSVPCGLFSHLPSTPQHHLFKGGTVSCGMAAHTSIIDPENASQVCLRANLIPSFPRHIQVCVKLTKTSSTGSGRKNIPDTSGLFLLSEPVNSATQLLCTSELSQACTLKAFTEG